MEGGTLDRGNSDYLLRENATYCACIFWEQPDKAGFRIEDSLRVGGLGRTAANYKQELFFLKKQRERDDEPGTGTGYAEFREAGQGLRRGDVYLGAGL